MKRKNGKIVKNILTKFCLEIYKKKKIYLICLCNALLCGEAKWPENCTRMARVHFPFEILR